MKWTPNRLQLVFLLAALESLLLGGPSIAHDFWSTSEPVPSWVKSLCCGPQDVHHLRASAVHILPDGFHIDGIETIVPMSHALPSPDGTYWAFWNPISEPKPSIFCFFAPLNGV